MKHYVLLSQSEVFFAIFVRLIMFRRRSLNKVRSCSSWTPHTAHVKLNETLFFFLFLSLASFMKSPAHPTRPKNRKERSKSDAPPRPPARRREKEDETILDLGSAKTPGFLRGGFSPIHSSRVFLRGRMTGDSLAIWVLSAEGGVEGNLSHSSHFGSRRDGASPLFVSDETKHPNFRVQRHCLGYLATNVIFETRWVRLHVPHAKTVTKSFAKGSEKEVSVGCSEVVKKSSFS